MENELLRLELRQLREAVSEESKEMNACNGYVLDKESLRILRQYGTRYVVQSVKKWRFTTDTVIKQTFFGYGTPLADTGYVVVGVDEHNRYLLADAAVWAELLREGLAKKEAAVYDDGQSADARVGLSSRE